MIPKDIYLEIIPKKYLNICRGAQVCRDFGRFIPLPAASDLVELIDGVDLRNGVIVQGSLNWTHFLGGSNNT